MQENSPDFTTINFEVQIESRKTISSGATEFFGLQQELLKNDRKQFTTHVGVCVTS